MMPNRRVCTISRRLGVMGLCAAALAGGCGGSAFGPTDRTVVMEGEQPDEVDGEPSYEPSARADLRVKRWRQLSLDLQGALALTPDEICRETGLYDCTELHVAQLGGVSVDTSLYEPITYWTVTTGLSIERVVLQACWNRLDKDRAGEPVVFQHVDLAGSTVSEAEATALSTDLWRRVLARDPSAEELSSALELHAGIVADGGGNAEWAAMLCFSLATSSEHLLY